MRFSTRIANRAPWATIIALGLTVSYLSPDAARAQVLFGTIVGRVTDSSGASVPGAALRATEIQTNDTRVVATNQAGEYTISTVSAGTYRLDVEKPGFQSFEASNVQVLQNNVARIDAQLQLWTQTEKVEVSALPTLISARIVKRSGQ